MMKGIGGILVVSTAALFLLACEEELPLGNFDNAVRLSNNVNSIASDAGADTSSDHKELYFHSDRTGGNGGFDIHVSVRASSADAWGVATNLGTAINSASDDRGATISGDGLTLIFGSDRAGSMGLNDLYISSRASVLDPWGSATNMGATLNTTGDESGPSISDDGLTLFFHSDRPGGQGSTDIYSSTRASTSDPWGAPSNLGSTVNSADFDNAPSISADGLTLYFHSTRAGGQGQHDTWKSERLSSSDPWGAPEAMPTPVNSSSIETGPSITSDDLTLYFASDRPGGDARDIWQVTR